MKLSNRFLFTVLSSTLVLSLIGCASQNNTTSNLAAGSSLDEEVSPTVQENLKSETEMNQSGESTPIILTINGTDVHGTLNSTVTAQEFSKLLPYTVTVSRAADDLCGSVSEQLANDSSQNSQGWKIGEIGWFGGWFTILVNNEEHFSDMSFPIIGAIDEADIPFVQSITGSAEITIRLADDQQTAAEQPVADPTEEVQPTDAPTKEVQPTVEPTEEIVMESNKMNIIVGNTTLTATLVDNSSTAALKEKLAEGPISIQMSDYGAMEKVGNFGFSLPRNDTQITTEAGDLILYQGGAFVIYYAPNSWNFTRLGKINNITAQELKAVLGNGNVTVTLSLD